MEAEIGGKPLFTRKDLQRLLIPLVIEQFLLMSVGMADTIMVTTAGEAVVSGISLVDNINILIINIFSALSTGGAVVVSQYLGRREPEKSRSAAKQLLYVAVAISLVLMLVGLIWREEILRGVFGKISDETMEAAMAYFLLTAAAYPFIAVYNAGAALFRAMGNSKVSMMNSLVVNIINVTVNAILIYGFGLGAIGAGVGTLVSRIVAAVIIMALITRPVHPVYIENVFRPSFRWPMVRSILGVGIPTGIENGMFQIGKLLVLNLITSFDVGVNVVVMGSAVAANAIANSVIGLINVPGSACGLAMVTVVSRCMGAGDHKQAVDYTKKILGICYVSLGVLSVGLFFGAGFLVELFNLTPATGVLTVQILRLYAVFNILIWPLSFVLPNTLRAAGDAKFTMVVSMLSMWSCRVGLSYFFGASWGLGLGLVGVWAAMVADWAVRSTAFVVRFARGRWKEKQVI